MESSTSSRLIRISVVSLVLVYLLGIIGYYFYHCSCEWGWRTCERQGDLDYSKLGFEAVLWPWSLVKSHNPSLAEAEVEGGGGFKAEENKQWMNIVEMDGVAAEVDFIEARVQAVFEGLNAAVARDMVQVAGKAAQAIEDLEDLQAQLRLLKVKCTYEKAYKDALLRLTDEYIKLYDLVKTEAPMLRLKEQEKPIAALVASIEKIKKETENLKATSDPHECE